MLCSVADQLADGENLPFLLRKMRGVAQKVEGELELAVSIEAKTWIAKIPSYNN